MSKEDIKQYAKEVAAEAKTMTVQAIKTKEVKQVLGATAAGAIIGAVVPLVGIMAGATIGGAYGVYRAFTEDKG